MDGTNPAVQSAGAIAGQRARRVELCCTVTRADGTIEEHGVVAFGHRSPVIEFFGRLRIRTFAFLGVRRVRVTRPGQRPRMVWQRIPTKEY